MLLVIGMGSGSSVSSGSVLMCPFDNLICSGGTCFSFCAHCGILKPHCSRFDLVKFNSKGFPRNEFGSMGKARVGKGVYRLG